MQLSSKILSLALMGICALLVYLLGGQCSKTGTWEDLANSRADSLTIAKRSLSQARDSVVSYRDKYLQCNSLILESKLAAAHASEQNQQSDQATKKTIWSLSQTAQRKAALKGLVENNNLPASRLIDTLSISLSDSVRVDQDIVRAVAISTQQLADCQQLTSLMQQSVGIYTVQVRMLADTLTGYRLAVVQRDNTILKQQTAIDNYLKYDCRGLFTRWFCRPCKQLRRNR